jgi:hypothetical protein
MFNENRIPMTRGNLELIQEVLSEFPEANPFDLIVKDGPPDKYGLPINFTLFVEFLTETKSGRVAKVLIPVTGEK